MHTVWSRDGKRLAEGEGRPTQHRLEASGLEPYVGRLTSALAAGVAAHGWHRAQGLEGLRPSMIDEDHVPPRHTHVREVATVGRRADGGEAERERQRILVRPGDLEVGRRWMITSRPDRILAGRDARQLHRMPARRIRIGRKTGDRAEDLLEDQDVARREGERSRARRCR